MKLLFDDVKKMEVDFVRVVVLHRNNYIVMMSVNENIWTFHL